MYLLIVYFIEDDSSILTTVFWDTSLQSLVSALISCSSVAETSLWTL